MVINQFNVVSTLKPQRINPNQTTSVEKANMWSTLDVGKTFSMLKLAGSIIKCQYVEYPQLSIC